MNVWVEAARPRTLPAAVAPVLVGTAAAQGFSAWRAAAALVVSVAVQVGVNYANDYFDGVRGIDTVARTGPRRAVAAGLVPAARMRTAILIALSVAAVAGLALATVTTWWLLAVGAACFAAALAYSGGPRPYASAGLGEVFVFVFFGLIATAGSAYVQDERVPGAAVAAALPVGLLIVAILVANNLRDIPSDTAAGKRTLAVRLGERGTRRLFAFLLVIPFPLVTFVVAQAQAPWPLLALLAAPLTVPPLRAVLGGAGGRALIPALASTGRLVGVFGVLLTLGLALS